MSAVWTKEGDVIKVVKDLEGVIVTNFEYKIAGTSAKSVFTGAPIPSDLWYQVTSFFQWTFDTTHSESQVRFFYNPKKKEWIAWAFPQEARTGMTAKELDWQTNEESRKQRAALPDAADLVLFMTVHHHCACTAFQSGVDQSNEIGQDGLHITVGSMDKERHDLHCRLYVSRVEFMPDMSRFWDIGAVLREDTPEKCWHDISVRQMGKKVIVPFPDQWKANLIEIKPAPVSVPVRGGDWHPTDWRGSQFAYGNHDNEPEWKRVEYAAQQAVDDIEDAGFMLEDLEERVQFVYKDKIIEAIFDACTSLRVDFEAVVRELSQFWDRYTTVVEDPNPPDPRSNGKSNKKRRKSKKSARPPETKPTPRKFESTHTIDNTPVVWDSMQQAYVRENGDSWSFEEHGWVKPDGFPVDKEPAGDDVGPQAD